MNRHAFRAGILRALAGAALLSIAPGTASAEWQYRVGFIAPLSGSAQNYGAWAKRGFEMGLASVKSDRLRVFYEDDQLKPANTVSAFRKLTQVDRVNLVVSIASTPSNAIAPLAQTAQIPLIAWASDSRVSRGRSYVMRSYFSGEEEGVAIAAEALRRDHKHVAIIIAVNDYTYSVREGLLSGLEGARIKYDQEVPADTQDFRPFILQALGKGTGEFFVCLNVGQFGLFAKQLRELKSAAQIFACENMQAADELKIASGTLEGAWFVTSDLNPEFLKKYEAALSSDALVPAVAVHYDLARLIAAAVDKAPNREGVWPQILESQERNWAVNSLGVAQRHDDRFLDTARCVMRVSGGRFEKVR